MLGLFAAAAFAAATPVIPPYAAPEPAMFVVRDADTTVYLFGTFHALDADTQWLGDGVRAAFNDSHELVLETLLPTISTPVPSGYPIARPSVTPSASFVATTRMAISAGNAQGMRVDQGADMVLRRLAEMSGKSVGGLESLQFQLNMFNRIAPPTTRPASFRAAARPSAQSMHGLSRTMAEMQAAWKRGDQNLFAGLLDQMRVGSPDMYRTMFAERNARWARWIEGRMQAPGTVFVAVGAGHLAGRDSLLVRLAERGIGSQRVN